jgi:hypothetical protein
MLTMVQAKQWLLELKWWDTNGEEMLGMVLMTYQELLSGQEPSGPTNSENNVV